MSLLIFGYVRKHDKLPYFTTAFQNIHLSEGGTGFIVIGKRILCTNSNIM
jgi:hypothetical protein